MSDMGLWRKIDKNMTTEAIKAEQPQPTSWSQVSTQTVLCKKCGRTLNEKMARQFAYCPFCGRKVGNGKA